MRRVQLRHAGTLILLGASCALLASPGFRAWAWSVANHLQGTWRVVDVGDRVDEHSAWQHWYGLHPSGYFIYDSTGHVSIQICPDPALKQFASGDDFKPILDEAITA
jgi:Lipocalin-like domain